MRKEKEFTQDADTSPIVRLLTRYVFWSLTGDEHERLDEWVAANDENMQLFENISDNTSTHQAFQLFSEAQSIRGHSLKKMKRALHF